MPVSSPSYFPPNRATGSVVGITAGTNTTGAKNFLAMKGAGLGSTASNLLVIGDSSCNQGLLAANIPNGLICLGNASLAGANLSDQTASAAGIICIGHGSAPTAAGEMGESIFIGSKILASATLDSSGGTSNDQNVLIGHNTLNTFGTDAGSQLEFNTFVGNDCLVSLTGASRTVENNVALGDHIGGGLTCGVSNCVFIGSNAAGFAGSTPGALSSLTVIGSFAFTATVCGAASRVVAIGDGAAAATRLNGGAVDAVVIGSNVASSLSNGTNITVVGSNTNISPNGTNNVILGDNIPSLGNTVNGCIVIGSHGAAVALPGTSGQLYIGFNGTAQGTGTGTAMWGLMSAGNLCLGTSGSTQREFGGAGATNVLKLITGTKGGSNPVGGGYFYVAGANNSLHWVNSGGVDSTLSDAATLTSVTLNAASGAAISVSTSTAANSISSTGGVTCTTETLTAAAPTVAAAQVGLGSTTATTATTGANGAPPAQVAGYLIINVAGTAQKIPYYNT